MQNMHEHPTIMRYNEKVKAGDIRKSSPKLSSEALRQMCMDLGADDVGFVEIGRSELEDQRADILNIFPWTKTFISFVGRLNRENLRSPARSIASLELHQVEDRFNHAAQALAAALERKSIRAATPAVGFPMETDQWRGKMHVVSHKPIAVAAGLGKMGDKSISIEQGHAGIPDVQVHADTKSWLRVLGKESSMVKEIILRRIKVKGPMHLFKAFGKCFA